MQGHYVPKFYLKGFTDPETPAGQEPFLWISTDGTSWRKRAPKNVAAEPHYYVTPEAEDDLQRMEGRLAPVLRKTLEPEPLSDEETMWLGMLVALMRFRVPAVHEQWQRFLSQRYKKRARLLHAALRDQPGRFENFKKEQGIGSSLPLEALTPDRFTFEATRAESIAISLDGLVAFLDVLMVMRWRILLSKAPHYFITSDHPVYVFDCPMDRREMAPSPVSPTAEITMPLGREAAFFATWPGGGVDAAVAEPEDVAHINLRSRSAAQRFLIGPKPNLVPPCPGP